MRKISAFSKRFLDMARSGHSLWPERICLCLAVLIAYASVWPDEFIFEDKFLIVLNGLLRHWSTLPQLLTSPNFAGNGSQQGFYRPVQMLVYFLIYQAFGASTVAFHALNIVLQALNACLLHHFGVRAGFRKGAAFAAALLWAVHPLHVVDVAYIPSTGELLWSSFCLLGLITLLPDFAPRRIWQAMIFFMLALSCKESAVVFPALAVITFFFVDKDRTRFAGYLRTWPLWLLATVYTAGWMLFIHKSGYNIYNIDQSGKATYYQDYISNFTNRVLTSLATLPVYARLIIWPAGLHTERVFPVFSTLLAWQPIAGALMVGLGLLQILWGRLRRNKYSSAAGGLALSFGLLWFAVALSPVTGIVIPIDARISDGWMYMPAMGLFLGVTEAVAGFFEKRQTTARVLVLVLALSLGTATFLQNGVWRNPETLYQNISRNGGRVDRLSSPLGLYYMEHGEFDKAAEQFRYAIDHPDGRPETAWGYAHMRVALALLQVRMDENDVSTLSDVISALPSCQHIPEAIGELGKALQHDPDFHWAHEALAAIYRYQGNNQMADFHEKQAEAILKKQGRP